MSNNNKIIDDKKLSSGSKSLALQSNTSLIPITLGLSVTGLFYVSEMLAYMYASLGVATIGGIILLTNVFFRNEHFKKVFVEQINKKIQKENKEKIEEMRKSLKNEKASKQITLFQKKHDRFEEVLNNQLTSSSLAYQRLLGGFDQLNLIALNNIEKVLNYESNMESIDTLYIMKEMKKLEKLSAMKDFEEKEYQSLKARLDLKKGYQEKINSILSDNESALTKMDLTLASLTDLKKPENMKEALSELQTLANVLDKRSEKY